VARAPHGELAPIRVVHFLAGLAGFEQRFHFFFREGFYRWLFEFGNGDGFDWTREIEFAAGPGEEGRQTDVEVAHGLGGQGPTVAAEPVRFIVGAHPHEVFLHILRLDPVHGLIAHMLQPQLEIMFVAAQGGGTESLGGFVLHKAPNCLRQ